MGARTAIRLESGLCDNANMGKLLLFDWLFKRPGIPGTRH
jgi:hypothetical protein